MLHYGQQCLREPGLCKLKIYRTIGLYIKWGIMHEVSFLNAACHIAITIPIRLTSTLCQAHWGSMGATENTAFLHA